MINIRPSFNHRHTSRHFFEKMSDQKHKIKNSVHCESNNCTNSKHSFPNYLKSLTYLLLTLLTLGIQQTHADETDDKLMVYDCSISYSDARGLFERYQNNRHEWVSFGGKPAYRRVKGNKTFHIYYQPRTSKWVLDENAMDETDSGVFSYTSTLKAKTPADSSWSSDCKVFPNAIRIAHAFKGKANRVLTIDGTNQSLPIYKHEEWLSYYHKKAKAWVIDNNGLSNTNYTGVLARGNKNQKTILLAEWSNKAEVRPAEEVRRFIASGWNQSCVTEDGYISCWGRFGFNTQVPKGKLSINSTYGVQLDAPTLIAGNYDFNCALDGNAVKCWGVNDNNHGEKPASKTLVSPYDLDVGYHHGCALDAEGIKCWGKNNVNQAPADQQTLNSQHNLTLDRPTQVAAGDDYSCAIDHDSIKCWGNHPIGNSTSKSISLKNPVSIDANQKQVCALDDDGLHCWGSFKAHNVLNVADSAALENHYGVTLNNPRQVALGQDFGCILDDDGAKCWGSNAYNRAPTIRPLVNAEDISLGERHACATDQEGTKCWGSYNSYNQLDVALTREVDHFEPWDSFDTEGDCACLLTDNTWDSSKCSLEMSYTCYDSEDEQNPWKTTSAKGKWYRGAYQCHEEFGPHAIFSSPLDENENQAIVDLLTSNNNTAVWINMSDRDNEGIWQPWSQSRFYDVLDNPNAEHQDLSGWEYSSHANWYFTQNDEHDHFSVETSPASNVFGLRSQSINLTQKGWSTAELNLSPSVLIEQTYWVPPGATLEACINIKLKKSSNNQQILYEWNSNDNCTGTFTNSSNERQQVTLRKYIENYGTGLRYIDWQDIIKKAYSGNNDERIMIANTRLSLLRPENTTAASAMAKSASLVSSGQSNLTENLQTSSHTPSRKIEKISVEIETGSHATNWDVFFNLEDDVVDFQPFDKQLFRGDFGKNSKHTYNISHFKKKQLSPDTYTGAIIFDCSFFFDYKWSLKSFKVHINDTLVYSEAPNVTLHTSSCKHNAFETKQAFHEFTFKLPDSLLILAVDQLFNTKQSIEVALNSINGTSDITLSNDQQNELIQLYRYYQAKYEENADDPAEIEKLKQREQIEYHQLIAYFQADRIYSQLSNRLSDSDDKNRFKNMRDALYETIVFNDNDTLDGYKEQAQEITTDLQNEFDQIIEETLCPTAESCHPYATAEEIHQALFWSQLVYESEKTINENSKHGLDEDGVYKYSDVHFVNLDGLIWGGHSSQVFMAAVGKSGSSGIKDIVIAFRGTKTFLDAITDANDEPIQHRLFANDAFGGPNIEVHTGFHNLWESHKHGVITQLEKLFDDNDIDKIRTIYITGHSLGAAVATISAPHIAYYLEAKHGIKDPKRLKVIHFGSPRTGGKNWAKHYNAMDDYFSSTRVWNKSDFVTKIPLYNFGWRHVDYSLPLLSAPPEGSGASWPSRWFHSDFVGDVLNLAYVEIALWAAGQATGVNIRNHMTEAYKFTVDRQLTTLPINQGYSNQPEKCVAVDQNGKLYDEPCNKQYKYLCEKLSNIALGKGSKKGIGKGSITWSSSWSLSSNTGTWAQHAGKCPSGKIFSIPSNSSDADKVKKIVSSGKVWVNYSRAIHRN